MDISVRARNMARAAFAKHRTREKADDVQLAKHMSKVRAQRCYAAIPRLTLVPAKDETFERP